MMQEAARRNERPRLTLPPGHHNCRVQGRNPRMNLAAAAIAAAQRQAADGRHHYPRSLSPTSSTTTTTATATDADPSSGVLSASVASEASSYKTAAMSGEASNLSASQTSHGSSSSSASAGGGGLSSSQPVSSADADVDTSDQQQQQPQQKSKKNKLSSSQRRRLKKERAAQEPPHSASEDLDPAQDRAATQAEPQSPKSTALLESQALSRKQQKANKKAAKAQQQQQPQLQPEAGPSRQPVSRPESPTTVKPSQSALFNEPGSQSSTDSSSGARTYTMRINLKGAPELRDIDRGQPSYPRQARAVRQRLHIPEVVCRLPPASSFSERQQQHHSQSVDSSTPITVKMKTQDETVEVFTPQSSQNSTSSDQSGKRGKKQKQQQQPSRPAAETSVSTTRVEQQQSEKSRPRPEHARTRSKSVDTSDLLKVVALAPPAPAKLTRSFPKSATEEKQALAVANLKADLEQRDVVFSDNAANEQPPPPTSQAEHPDRASAQLRHMVLNTGVEASADIPTVEEQMQAQDARRASSAYAPPSPGEYYMDHPPPTLPLPPPGQPFLGPDRITYVVDPVTLQPQPFYPQASQQFAPSYAAASTAAPAAPATVAQATPTTPSFFEPRGPPTRVHIRSPSQPQQEGFMVGPQSSLVGMEAGYQQQQPAGVPPYGQDPYSGTHYYDAQPQYPYGYQQQQQPYYGPQGAYAIPPPSADGQQYYAAPLQAQPSAAPYYYQPPQSHPALGMYGSTAPQMYGGYPSPYYHPQAPPPPQQQQQQQAPAPASHSVYHQQRRASHH